MFRKLIVSSLSIIVGLFFSFAQTTYYVDATNGNDLNHGTSKSAAWKTLTHVGSQSFSPGDNVLLKRGETFVNPLYFPSSGEYGAPIKIGVYGKGNEKAVLNIKSDTVTYGVAFLFKAHLILENLEITGNCRFGVGVRGGSHNIIRDCHIHHIAPGPWHGIVMGEQPEHLKILRNEISHCGLEGIYGSSRYVEIAYNHIHNINLEKSVGDCLQLNLTATEFHVHHNVFDRSMSAGGKGCVVCSDTSSVLNGVFEYNTVICAPNDNFGFSAPGRGCVVRYNTFKGSPSSQFAVKGPHLIHHNIFDTFDCAFDFGFQVSDYKVYNNIFKNIGRYVVYIPKTPHGDRYVDYEFKNNISDCNQFRDSSNGKAIRSHNIYTNGTTDEPGSMVTDPLFVSDTDYHLKKGSPAIHAGIKLGLSKDFDGKFIGDNPSIGIYQNAVNK